MNEFIITSEIDYHYFIVNNGVYSINVLADMLKEFNADLANILLSTRELEETRNNLIFIPKDSELGNALNELIKRKKIVDASEIITPKHLTNALISQRLFLEDEYYLNKIIEIIKDKETGTVSELKDFYDEDVLMAINNDARYVWHFSDEQTRKYYNSMALTGYEEAGITYHEGMWYYANIHTYEYIPIKQANIKVRTKINNQN